MARTALPKSLGLTEWCDFSLKGGWFLKLSEERREEEEILP